MLLKPLNLATVFIFFSTIYSFCIDLSYYEKSLAISDKFYYILDCNEKLIILKFNGIEMRRYKFETIKVIVPKIFFIKLKPLPFPSVFYIRNLKIDPPVYLIRPSLNPQEKKEEEKPKIPPTLEELIKVPKEFNISGNENYSLSVSLKKEANFSYKIPFWKKVGKRFKDFWKGLTLKKEPILFIEMENEEGEKFYRSFQENSDFLIVLKQ